MKTGWEYKKLGEICDVVTKGTTPTTVGFKFIDKGINFVKVECFENGRLNKQKMSFVSDECHNALLRSQLKENDILFCIAGSIGKTAIVTKDILPANTNQACCIIRINSEFSNDRQFILWFLQSNKIKKFIESLKTGIAQPNLTLEHVRNFQIPDISTTTKTSIVSELDSLSKIIADCKETLKDYDALEQSIFYDMFGDPVKNEKGWEVKKLGEVGNIQRGSGLSKKDLVEEGYPCILYGQIHTKFGAYIKKHIACIPKDLVCTAKIAHYGDLVMAITSEDVEGSCKSTAWMGDYDIAVGSDAAIFRHNQNGIYVSYYTRTNAFYHEKAKYARGFKVTHISTKEIETIPILLPPLPLQQQFASKIEAIEQMKSETKKALQEAETLFNARMDYWFN